MATFPGEWQEDHWPDWRVFPASDERDGRSRCPSTIGFSIFPVDPDVPPPTVPFSSTLVLPGLNIYEGLNIDDPEKAEWRDFVFRAAAAI